MKAIRWRGPLTLALLLGGALSAADPKAREEPAFTLEDGDAQIEGVQISPDGKLIAARDRHQVRVWSLPEGKLLYRLDQRPRYMGGPAFTFTRDGKSLLVWSAREELSRDTGLSRDTDERVCWHEQKTGKEVRKLLGSEVIGSCLAQSPDGKLMLTSGRGKDDHALYVREPLTGRAVFKIDPPGRVRREAFTPDSKRLYVANRADEIWCWDLATKERTQWRKQDPELSGINWLAFTPDGKRLAAGYDRGVALLDVGSGRLVCQTDLRPDSRAAAFVRGGKWLLQGYGSYVFVFDAGTGKRLFHTPALGSIVKEFAISPDEKWLAVSTERRPGIRVFKLSEW